LGRVDSELELRSVAGSGQLQSSPTLGPKSDTDAGAETARVENAAVENTTAIKYGKKSKQKTLRYYRSLLERIGLRWSCSDGL